MRLNIKRSFITKISGSFGCGALITLLLLITSGIMGAAAATIGGGCEIGAATGAGALTCGAIIKSASDTGATIGCCTSTGAMIGCGTTTGADC